MKAVASGARCEWKGHPPLPPSPHPSLPRDDDRLTAVHLRLLALETVTGPSRGRQEMGDGASEAEEVRKKAQGTKSGMGQE
jgi:hypothetical protein